MVDNFNFSQNAMNKITRRVTGGGGIGERGVHLSPRIHQDYTFRHRSACRITADSVQECLTSGKEYIK